MQFWGLIAIALLLAGGAVAAALMFRPEPVGADLCPTSGPTAIHAILIDRSDPITPLQAQRVQQALDRLLRESQPASRIDLFVAEGDGASVLRPAFSRCNPGRTTNALFGNPRRVEDRFRTEFAERFEEAATLLLQPHRRSTSPIVESIKATCIAAFGSGGPTVQRSLLVVSDLVQNSPVHSQLRGVGRPEDFVRSPGFASVAADCRGAKVEAIYLMRREFERLQTRGHQFWWEIVLRYMNASLDRIEPV